MGTKLKNYKKQILGGFLLFGWLMTPTLLILAMEFWNYGYHEFWKYAWTKDQSAEFRMASTVLAALAAVSLLLLLALSFLYWKKCAAKEQIKESRVDRVPTELAVLVVLLSAWQLGVMFADAVCYPGADLYFSGMVLISVKSIVLAVLKIVGVSLVFYTGILLLYRKIRLKITKQTSAIWRGMKTYKEKTPWETQLQNKKRGYVFLVGLVCVQGIFYTVLPIYQYGFVYAMRSSSPLLTVLLGGSSLLLAGITIRTWRKGGIFRDMGKLAEQIALMSEGESIPEELRLSEKSFFHETDRQLAGVSDSMAKSVEKQLQAERLKVDLITNMSHDLKTPLTSMIGYTDLLKKEELNDTARDYVDVIALKQEQLRDMIQDVFDLSKATSNAEQLNMERLDMVKLFEQILADMEDRIQEEKREIRTDFPEEGLYFMGDNGKMYRVVQNLLENALKYSLPDTRIYISVKQQGNQAQAVMKNIAGYEMNFSPEEIMERFVRGDAARTTKGHGLGLAIASSYVKNMGGSLNIEIDGDLLKIIMEFPGTET